MDNQLIPSYISACATGHSHGRSPHAALPEGADLAAHGELAEIYSPAAFLASKDRHYTL